MSRPTLLRPFLGTLATNAAIVASGLISGLLAARLLGPEQRGILAAMVFWPGLIASMGFLSLREAVVYRAGRAQGEEETIVSSALLVALVLSVLTAAVGAFVLPMTMAEQWRRWVPLTTVYLLFFMPSNFVGQILLALDQAAHRFGRFNLVRLLTYWTYSTGLLILWLLGTLSAATALFAAWAGTFVVATVGCWIHRRRLAVRPSWRVTRNLLQSGTSFHGATVLFILASQADRALVMLWFDPVVVGHYVVAQTLAAAALGVISQGVQLVLFPKLASIEDVTRRTAQLGLGLRYATLLLATATLGLLVITPWILPLLFGSSFAAAVPLALLLEVAFLPLALRQIAVSCLRAFNDGRTGAIVEGTALGLFAVGAEPMVAVLGVHGIPVALVAANLGALAVLTRRLKTSYGQSVRELWHIDAALARGACMQAVSFLKSSVEDNALPSYRFVARECVRSTYGAMLSFLMMAKK